MWFLKHLSVKRVLHILCVWLSNLLPPRGHHKYMFTRWGGINITGECYIYKSLYVYSVAPTLKTIDKNTTIAMARGPSLVLAALSQRIFRHIRYGQEIQQDI